MDGSFLFSMGFFIFCMVLAYRWTTDDQKRTDYRKDLDYQRMLQERREFGYRERKDHIHPPPRRTWFND